MNARVVWIFVLLSFPFVSPAQSLALPDTVVAQQGEGIFALLRRCERDPASYFADFLELNKESLRPDSSLYLGRAYLIPPLPAPDSSSLLASADKAPIVAEQKETPAPPQASETKPAEAPPSEEKNIEESKPGRLNEPLFGKKYAELEIRDRRLEGAVYYLLAGHGGPDPGAIAKYGPYELSEDEYAYDVTLRLARRLMEHGATVYMIIRDENDGIRDDSILPMDTDELHYPDKEIPYSQKLRLRERTAAVNTLYSKHKGAYQRMLAIHVDSRSRGENIDVFFYHHANSLDGRSLAESIHHTFLKKYSRHQPGRDYHGSVNTRSSLYVVKYSHPPTVFIELGNIRNERDRRRFVLADNRQALANWIAEGVLSERMRELGKE